MNNDNEDSGRLSSGRWKATIFNYKFTAQARLEAARADWKAAFEEADEEAAEEDHFTQQFSAKDDFMRILHEILTGPEDMAADEMMTRVSIYRHLRAEYEHKADWLLDADLV